MKANAAADVRNKKALSSRGTSTLSLSASPLAPASRVDSACDADAESEQTTMLQRTKKAIDQLKSVTGNDALIENKLPIQISGRCAMDASMMHRRFVPDCYYLADLSLDRQMSERHSSSLCALCAVAIYSPRIIQMNPGHVCFYWRPHSARSSFMIYSTPKK